MGYPAGSTIFYRSKVTGDNGLTGFGVETSFSLPAVAASSAPSSPSVPPPPVSIPSVSVQSATLSTQRVTPGSPVTVTAIVTNKGTVNGTARITVYINGQEEASQGVAVSSGNSVPVTCTVSRNEPGSYTVYVGGVNAGSFVVDEFSDPGIILILSCALLFASFLLGLIYLWRKQSSH